MIRTLLAALLLLALAARAQAGTIPEEPDERFGLVCELAAIAHQAPTPPTPPRAPALVPSATTASAGRVGLLLASYQPAAGSDALLNPFADAGPQVAAPAGAAPTEPDPVDTAGKVVQSVRAGRWRDAVAGLVVLLMIGLQRLGARSGVFRGDRGGAALVMLVTLCAGASAAIASGSALADFRLWWGVLMTAATAAGGWTLLKKILAPSDGPAWGPTWLRRALGMT